MPDKSKYNLTFRPQSYWDDPLRTLLANIKGEHRRRTALDLIRQGRLDALEQWLVAERLPDRVRELAGQIHPMFMGGEYLPDFAEGEVEIARVSLESTTSDVISIRAKRKSGAIDYRIVDEYESAFKFAPKVSKEPLTLGELITLIDCVEYQDSDGSKGLTNSFRDSNFEAYRSEDASQRARELVDFVRVTSSFYPELERWYRHEAQEWLEEHTRKNGGADQTLPAC